MWGSRRHTPWTDPLTRHASILPILSPETRAMKEALRGVGFQETHPTYLFYPQTGVGFCGVPGDTPQALNHLNKLPILW